MSLRLISILILLGTMPVMATANSNDPPTDNEGYYLLDSAEDLFWFAELSNNIDFSDEFFNANAKLVNDITVNGDSFPWTPICSREQPSRVYTGTFDGQGYTISGLQCSIIDDVYDEEYVGFFGTIGYGGTVKNLGIKDSHFSNDNNVGGIAGWNKGGTVTNCYITDSSLEGNVVGGIVAFNDEEMTISNCYSTVSCIVGDNHGTVSNCYSTVSGNDGIVNYNENGNLSNCYYLVKEAIAGNSSAKTPAQFASGEVAYLLQGEQGNQVWGQNIDNGQEKQNYPVLSTENKVYQKSSVCDQCGYFNYEHSGYVYHLHIDGICGCGHYQEPELVDGVYQIANAGNLYWFANHVNSDRDAAAKIVDNIDLNPLYTLNNDGTVTVGAFTYDEESLPDDFRIWTPIGTADDRPYIGTFDGNNKTISGLYYNDEDGYGGLFGYIGYMNEGAVIENLGVINSYIEGAYAGAIVACHIYGGIFNCYNTGTVKTNEYAGGISAYFEEGEIRNCYSTGEILRSYEEAPVGGIVGYDVAGIVSNCYYLKDDGGINSDIYGIGESQEDTEGQAEAKTSAQFASGEVAYLLKGGQTGDWGQLIDPNSNNIYPILGGGEDIVVYQVYNECMGGYSYSNEYGDIEHNFDENGFCQTEGCISPCQEPTTDENGVYQIANAGNLYWFAAHVNAGNTSANAKLMNDIVVNTDVLNDSGELNEGPFREWTPIGYKIGTNRIPFTGTFDGDNKTISGLYVETSENDRIGFFGYTGAQSIIKNLGIVDSYFNFNSTNSESYVGGIVGYHYSTTATILNCYSAAFVNGNYAGGIAGHIDMATISGCYNLGKVNGNFYAGGISGGDNSGTILNCYNAGDVKCQKNNGYAGGIVGNAYIHQGLSSKVSNCYNIASVSSAQSSVYNKIGGVVGEADDGIVITNCYYLYGKATGGINGTDVENQAVFKTTEEFASGEVAWLLQKEQTTHVWGQNIGADAYPVLGGAKVYKKCNEENSYSNIEPEDDVHSGLYDDNGFCTLCGAYEPAAVVNNVYQIANAGNLYWFANHVNSSTEKNNTLAANAKLTADITVNENVLVDGELNSDVSGFRQWTPIGNSSNNKYNGSFDGQGYTISGLYYSESNDNVGLFGYTYECSINNLGVIDSYFNANEYVGGIVGYADSYTSITNCYSISNISGNAVVGGIAGLLSNIGDNRGSVTNCYNAGLISGKTETGAIVGCNAGSVTNCFFDNNKYNGNATGYNSNTGIVDKITCGKATNDFSSGEVAYLLQNGVPAPSENEPAPQVWGQNIDNGKEVQAYPVLSDARVYRFGNEGSYTYTNKIGANGTNVLWLHENNTLTIYGSGNMRGFEANETKPWSNYLSEINTVVVKAGITGIGTNAFSDIENLTSLFYYKSAQPDSWGENWINSGSTVTVYVPATDLWSGFSVGDCIVQSMPTYTGTWSKSPDANSHVVINSALVLGQQSTSSKTTDNSNVLTVSSFGLTESGIITIKAGEQMVNDELIDFGGQLICQQANGEVTVEKTIYSPNWYTISSPLKGNVSASSVNSLIPDDANTYALYRYDEPTHYWQNYKYQDNNFTTLDAGRGYLYARSNSEVTTLQFKGDINTKPVQYALTVDGDALQGFHLVGNPFTHNITISQFSTGTSNTLVTGYYVLSNQGAWAAEALTTGVIKPGQGILIKTTAAATLTISPNATTAKGQEPRAKSQEPMLSLNVTNGNYSDRAFVIFGKGIGLDKINHQNEEIPVLYIPMSDADYAIAMMDENVNEIPVGFESSSMGEFTISLRQENCEFEELYLLDKETGAKVNILEQDYTFMTTSGDNPDRFILVKSQGSQPEAQSNFAYINNGDVVIYGAEGNAQIDIYDVLGRRVYNNNGSDDVHIVNTDGYSAGVYVIRLMDEKGVRTQKVIID